jgi:hypothetical protein
MPYSNNIKDREYQKFRNRNGQTVVAVEDLIGSASSAALATLKFWELTGVDISQFNFVVKEDQEPVVSNSGEFVVA